ncbi:hypothetical protein C8Q73DRAFT_669541 [Cubamyces lactineus]|nr:hypothetical protein C8Q73DRAFT_669541 [Cubamyces lactineus]
MSRSFAGFRNTRFRKLFAESVLVASRHFAAEWFRRSSQGRRKSSQFAVRSSQFAVRSSQFAVRSSQISQVVNITKGTEMGEYGRGCRRFAGWKGKEGSTASLAIHRLRVFASSQTSQLQASQGFAGFAGFGGLLSLQFAVAGFAVFAVRSRRVRSRRQKIRKVSSYRLAEDVCTEEGFQLKDSSSSEGKWGCVVWWGKGAKFSVGQLPEGGAYGTRLWRGGGCCATVHQVLARPPGLIAGPARRATSPQPPIGSALPLAPYGAIPHCFRRPIRSIAGHNTSARARGVGQRSTGVRACRRECSRFAQRVPRTCEESREVATGKGVDETAAERRGDTAAIALCSDSGPAPCASPCSSQVMQSARGRGGVFAGEAVSLREE